MPIPKSPLPCRRCPAALRALGLLLALAPACQNGSLVEQRSSPREPLAYPKARRAELVEEIHGVPVADPYRWLEDPDSPETRAWIAAQNELFEGYLAGIPRAEEIRARLREVHAHASYRVPLERGGRLFYLKRPAGAEQHVLYAVDPGGEERALLDPVETAGDGTVAIHDFAPSPDGALVALGFSEAGSDWRLWRVLEVASGELLADVVRWNKFGGVEWAADGSGFYYSRYDPPAQGQGLVARNDPADVYFHRIGADPEEDRDRLVRARPSRAGVSQRFRLTEDGGAMIVVRRDAATNGIELDYQPMKPWIEASLEPEHRPLVAGYDARYRPIGDDGNVVWVLTDLDAPRWRIVAIDPADPARESWREVVPEGELAIQQATAAGGRLVVSYLRDAVTEVRVLEPSGKLAHVLDLPGLGTASGFRGRFSAPEAYFAFRSFARPSNIYRLDVAAGEVELFRAPELAFDPGDFAVRQVFYESKDGTSVPMFLVSSAKTAEKRDVPTYLYGYGGFDIAITPFFDAANLVWMEMGGLLAVANIRGGGEYGEEWHEAGIKTRKQNVFDDFIAAAEHLIGEGITSSERLAIGGRSNGGLLVGACLTQRPELFGAAVPMVGVHDMLRYHRFTIGWSWAGDYGTADDPDEFRALHAYSPLHNVRPGIAYPATLVMTADHDDRVVPAHSFKFAAAMQAAQAGSEPILARIETRAGHGSGKPKSMVIEDQATRLAFLVRELGLER